MHLFHFIWLCSSSPKLKKYSSLSSESQDLDPFSQGSNFSDTSDVGVKRELLKIEFVIKSQKIEAIQNILKELHNRIPIDPKDM